MVKMCFSNDLLEEKIFHNFLSELETEVFRTSVPMTVFRALSHVDKQCCRLSDSRRKGKRAYSTNKNTEDCSMGTSQEVVGAATGGILRYLLFREDVCKTNVQ
jgi:hypothetical protein